MSYVNLDLFDEYVEKGLLIKQTHPTLPLTIWNYSRTCQYDRLWDEVTMACRGLVTDDAGKLIAKPFPKFFNYEEHTTEEIPNELFEVYEKMDGSLGIYFYYNNEWHMATRGSFTSEQAIKGKELLGKYNFEKLHTDYTYLFEIIYKENRIVCNYDFEDVVLLGVINTKTGIEVNLNSDTEDVRIQNIIKNIGLNVVMRYNTFGEGFDELKREISNSKEGYVIRFKNGMRMKIKGDEYVRLHRILTNFSTTDIWELLRTNGNMDEFLDRVPDEFDNWVRMTVLELKAGFENIKFRSSIDFEYYKGESNGDKKEFALAINDNEYRSILFSMWDGKSYDDIIWKMIKPKWSKPFKKDIDN
jgi:RNA ligase